jgi:hypothetical protein
LAKLPKIRSKWPKQVTLKVKSYFQIIEDGRAVGIQSKEAGTVLDLVEVKPQHAVVFLEGGQSALPVEQCDLVERMGGEAAILALTDDPSPALASPSKSANPPKSSVESKSSAPSAAALAEKLIRLRSRWPKEVTLRDKSEFPEFEAGKLTGTHTEQAGVILRLISVEKNGVLVLVSNSPAILRLEQTDLIDRMGGAAAVLALPDDPATEQTGAPKAAEASKH